jgi:hypothetical protein
LTETATAQSELQTTDQCLMAVLSRSFFAALTLLGNTPEAEAVVVEAIRSLSPRAVTADGLTNAVVKRLVQVQTERNNV